jgi:hypothetical protein
MDGFYAEMIIVSRYVCIQSGLADGFHDTFGFHDMSV